MNLPVSDNERGTSVANKLRSSASRLSILGWTTVDENAAKCISFRINLETPLVSTTVCRNYSQFSELHAELIRQFPNFDVPALPRVVDTLNSTKMEEHRVDLENFLIVIVKRAESWSCPAFSSFFSVQSDVSAVDLTSEIVGYLLNLGQENAKLSNQLKTAESALIDATARIQQLENRLFFLEQGNSGFGRLATSRSGSVSMTGERISDATPITSQNLSKPKHRFSYVSNASDIDSIASNSVCFDETEQLPSPHGERRPSGGGMLFMPDARKFRRPSEQRSTYFSLSGDILYESETDQRVVVNRLETSLIQGNSKLLNDRIDEIVLSILPQKEQVALRSDVRNFVSNEIFKSLGVHPIDIGHYRLRCFLPNEAIELGITVAADEEELWCEKFVQDVGCLLNFASGDKAKESFETSGSPVFFSISNLTVSPPNSFSAGSWKVQFSVGSVSVSVSTVSRSDLCMVAFFEEVDQLVGKDHLFKRSIILLKAWWQYDSCSIAGNLANSWNQHTWLLCSLVSVLFNKNSKRIQHPMDALVLFFTEFAYFDWKTQLLSLSGAIAKTDYSQVKSGSSVSIAGAGLINEEVILKYRELAKMFAVETLEPKADELCSLGWSSFAGIIIEHPLLNGINIFNDPRLDPELTAFVVGLKSGVLLLYNMINSNQDVCSEDIDNFFEGTITRFRSKAKKEHQANLSIERAEVASPVKSESLSSWWNFKFSGSLENGSHHQSTNSSEDLLCSARTTDTSQISDDTRVVLTPPEKCSLVGPSRPSRLVSSNLLKSSRPLSPSHLPPGIPQAQVSEVMLKTLALDILSTKGPLPVGEIGKMLQEVIKVPSLSSILREYFGGLKKFLEKYSDDFLISTDHPFNPNVYVRSTLTADDLLVISKGRMPVHFEMTYKKKGANRRKNSKSQVNLASSSSQVSAVDDIQSQLTRYFSSLPLQNANTSVPSREGNISASEATSLETTVGSIFLKKPDNSMRRRSYPHEDINTSRMLKSLFGNSTPVVENRLSDPIHPMQEYDSMSQLFGDDAFIAAADADLWLESNGENSDKGGIFGQPNPQAPIFIPQRNRVSK